jgi:hypothetical protein
MRLVQHRIPVSQLRRDGRAQRQARGEPAADTEPPDGEPVLEAFAQARRRIGPTRLELRVEVVADRFVHPSVPAGRHPGEHPFHHDLRQQVIVGMSAGLVNGMQGISCCAACGPGVCLGSGAD